MFTPQPEPNSVVVSVGVQCDVGRQRTENQDRVTRSATPYGDLFVVADGVGGYQGGAEAAQATVDGFARYLVEYANLPLADALQLSASKISGELKQRAAEGQNLHGMGSTVVLCIVNRGRVTYAHAGDSRLYLARHGKLEALTRDHSVMERMVSAGILTSEQASNHPDASVLTRALGQGADVTLDIAEMDVAPDDALLLCSDGLWGYARHEEMEAIANSPGLSPSAVAAALLNLALEGGGGDNISIQFLRFTAQGPAVKPAAIAGMPRTKILAASGLILLMALSAGGLYVWNHNHAPATASAANSIASPVPAGANTTSTAPPPSSPKQKTQVLIIAPATGNRYEWMDALNKEELLSAAISRGSEACRNLERAKDSILYPKEKRQAAKRVQEVIGVPEEDMVEVAAGFLHDCQFEIVVLPPKPAPSQSLAQRLHKAVNGQLNKLPAPLTPEQ